MKTRLIHYSNKRLEFIDPNYQGSNTSIRGAERSRNNRVPRSYWYRGEHKREVGLGIFKHEWTGNLKLIDLDMLEDQEPTKLEESILLEYDGYYRSCCPDIVVVFRKLKPQRIKRIK